MTGWGYHWTPCSGAGASMSGLGGVALAGALIWLAPRLIWIAAVSAGCWVLTVAAVLVIRRLMRGEVFARPDMEYRAAVGGVSRPPLAATVIPQVSQGTAPPAIENHYHIHFGPADREAAAIIRQAIPGTAGDPDTRKE